MKPRISKAVHYRSRGSADGVFPPLCRAAMITKVHTPVFDIMDDGYNVDLAVFHPDGLLFATDIPHNMDMVPGTWHYPDHDDDFPAPPDDDSGQPAVII